MMPSIPVTTNRTITKIPLQTRTPYNLLSVSVGPCDNSESRTALERDAYIAFWFFY